MILDEDAIHNLIPNTEWHYKNGVLTVFTKNVVVPTPEEIAAEKIKLEKVKTQVESEAEAKRELALAKLAALGLDADDFKALGL